MRLFSTVVVAMVSYVAYKVGWRQHAYYRLWTATRAVRAVAGMSQEQVEGFLKSYEIFERESFDGSPEELKHLLNYYGVLNHLCAIGDYEKMYAPPRIDPSVGVYENQIIYEERMADALNISAGSKVLDIGCGRGRIAHHVSSYTGASVTGINIDPVQLGFAREYAEQTGMDKKVNFVEHDYNKKLPFPDHHFDGLYYVQVLSYPTDLERFFAECFRVVKPGGFVAFEDYVKGPSYNGSDAEQRRLLMLAKPVLGGVVEVKPAVLQAAIEAVGFRVLSSKSEDFEGEGWQLLQESIEFFVPLNHLVNRLSAWGLMPHTAKLMLDRMNQGAEAMVEASKRGVVSLGWVTIAQKPK